MLFYFMTFIFLIILLIFIRLNNYDPFSLEDVIGIIILALFDPITMMITLVLTVKIILLNKIPRHRISK